MPGAGFSHLIFSQTLDRQILIFEQTKPAAHRPSYSRLHCYSAKGWEWLSAKSGPEAGQPKKNGLLGGADSGDPYKNRLLSQNKRSDVLIFT